MHSLHTYFSHILHKTKSLHTKSIVAHHHKISTTIYHLATYPLAPSFRYRENLYNSLGDQEEQTVLGTPLTLLSIIESEMQGPSVHKHQSQHH